MNPNFHRCTWESRPVRERVIPLRDWPGHTLKDPMNWMCTLWYSTSESSNKLGYWSTIQKALLVLSGDHVVEGYVSEFAGRL